MSPPLPPLLVLLLLLLLLLSLPLPPPVECSAVAPLVSR